MPRRAARCPGTGTAVRRPGPAIPEDRQRHGSAPWVSAKPKAAAMKGAVQGAATATASTPVKKAPNRCRLSAGEPLAGLPVTAADFEQARGKIDAPPRTPAARNPPPRWGTEAGSPSRLPHRRNAAATMAMPKARAKDSTAPGGIGKRFQHRCAPFRARPMGGQRQRLHRQDGQHARHHIHDQPAEERRKRCASHREMSPPASLALKSAGGTGPGDTLASSAWVEPSDEVRHQHTLQRLPLQRLGAAGTRRSTKPSLA